MLNSGSCSRRKETMKTFTLVVMFSVLALFISVHSAIATENGKSIFTASKCITCHGEDGKGNEKMKGMVKGDMTKLDLTDKATVAKTDVELAKIISDGAKPMKAYKDLSSDQVSELVKYVRILQKAAK